MATYCEKHGMQHYCVNCKTEQLQSQLTQAQKRIEKILAVVNEQAEDLGLWSIPTERPQYIAEAYLQQELRRLHEVIEGKTKEECAREALKEDEHE